MLPPSALPQGLSFAGGTACTAHNCCSVVLLSSTPAHMQFWLLQCNIKHFIWTFVSFHCRDDP
jgi:hypothetical protein